MDRIDKIADEVMNRIQKRPNIVRMEITAEPKREGIERKHIENVYDINLLADGVRYVMSIRSIKSKEQKWPDREYLCLDDYDITVHQCYPNDKSDQLTSLKEQIPD